MTIFKHFALNINYYADFCLKGTSFLGFLMADFGISSSISYVKNSLFISGFSLLNSKTLILNSSVNRNGKG
jgi:hypothetical protein